MSKLPKRLSFNSKPRSTSLANKTQNWQERTSERSASAILYSLVKSGPKERKTPEERAKALMANIKKERNRIRKLKAFARTPENEALILKKEGIINRCLFLLQDINDFKNKVDHRELSKFQNSPKDPRYLGLLDSASLVKLEKGKIVPSKDGQSLVHHRNAPSSFMEKVKFHAEEAKKEKVKRKMQFSPEIQAEIDKVFVPITEPIDEDEFERMMNNE